MVGRQKFASDAKVQSVVCQWLGQQPASFFASAFRRDTCLNELGSYVEK